MPKNRDPRIIVALDYDDQTAALRLVDQLTPQHCRLKIGKGMFTRYGTEWVRLLVNKGFDIFLDLKFHDIPEQVAKASAAAADLNVWMINVHAQGGRRMMEAARDAIDKYTSGRKPLLTAVTVLTSMDAADIQDLGWSDSLVEHVKRLALLAKQSGLDGVVCSPQEITILREICGKDFCLVTPGIRSGSVLSDDQRRTLSAKEAIQAGADYLVIGRPITQAAEPMAALIAIELDMAS